MTKMRILVVEDESLVAEDIRETLEMAGYEVTKTVSSGEEAMIQVEIDLPDLVLMDILLAGHVDGIEAAEKIQSRFSVPIVYLTANADERTLSRVKGSHPFGYVLKPFDERMLLMTIDIALSRHKTESEVHQALSKAEFKAENKSEQLATAFHELRNPLAIIRMTTEILKCQGDHLPPEKKQQHLERIQAMVNSLNFLLEDILTLERMDSKQSEFFPRVMDLNNLCQEQIEAWQFTTDNKYTFDFSMQGDCSALWLDEKLMWHILNNLLSNAVKYSPEGSTITLQLDCQTDLCHMVVVDQGIGIPEEALHALFKPFFRAGNVGTIDGTGLGLAIVQHCVDLHGGTIAVHSTVGQGTRFEITLPKCSEELKCNPHLLEQS